MKYLPSPDALPLTKMREDSVYEIQKTAVADQAA